MGWWRKRNKKRTLKRGEMLLKDLIECSDGKSNPIKFFSADEILKATDHFSESNLVSGLTYFSNKWYSCKNKNHQNILIKKGKFYVHGEEIFPRDIAISSMVSGHKNFLKLVGCCLEFEDPVMVYHGAKKHYKLDLKEQPWERRMKIAEDIATALSYLHTAFPRPFVYRSLFLDDILLDEDGVAKLTDFSFCVSIPEGETFVQVDREVGIYNDKYVSSGVVSEETDVFAIGILMQMLLMGIERFWQILIGKGEADGEEEDVDVDSCDFATMSKMNYLGPDRQFQFRQLKFLDERRADPKLCQMKAFLMLSLRCLGRKGEVPTMVEVAKELKKIQRSLRNDSSSPSGETQFDSAQDINSSLLSN